MQPNTPIKRIDVSAYTIPTDFPESDGTLEWDSTTIVIAEVYAADKFGIGYTYGDVAAGAGRPGYARQWRAAAREGFFHSRKGERTT